VIIGTIHSAHYENSNYSPEKLKGIILSLKPDAILNELPLSLVDPNGRPLERIRRKGNPGGPESWAADTVAQQLGIKQIPFDRPDRQKNFRKTKYFEKEKKAKELRKKCSKCLVQNEPNSINVKIAQLQGYAGQAEWSLFKNAKPEVINSEAHDSIIRIKKSLWYEIIPEILGKYPECKELIELDHFFRDQWNIRNKIMVENIIKVAKEYPGKRLVVITGATHRYILRDLLKDNPNVEVKEYWENIPAGLKTSKND
jgi:pheromone shutdown protein TraB